MERLHEDSGLFCPDWHIEFTNNELGQCLAFTEAKMRNIPVGFHIAHHGDKIALGVRKGIGMDNAPVDLDPGNWIILVAFDENKVHFGKVTTGKLGNRNFLIIVTDEAKAGGRSKDHGMGTSLLMTPSVLAGHIHPDITVMMLYSANFIAKSDKLGNESFEEGCLTAIFFACNS